jgi:general secretion pathway protein E
MERATDTTGGGTANGAMRWRGVLGFRAESVLDEMEREGLIAAADRRLAKQVAVQQDCTVIRALLDLGLVAEDRLASALGAACGVGVWGVGEDEAHESERAVSELVPLGYQRGNGVLVFAGETEDAPVCVVLADPAAKHAVRSVFSRLGDRLGEVLIGTQKQIETVLDGARESGAEAPGDSSPVDTSSEVAQLRDMASEAPVIRFWNQVVERAMDLGASDIHLERFDRRVDLRLRVDGMLLDQTPPPLELFEALLSRIKIMASLDLAERRRAQDGRMRMRTRGRNVDMRVSLVPTLYGQDAAIRIQDRQKLGEVTLEELGFSDEQVVQVLRTAMRPNGMLLVTGPTGSGKTTTLYAVLRRLVTRERKVMTVEDPVEYAMSGVNQIQVNPAINLSFSNTLRHVLRHDPDVILVGEIRDTETAQMAFQAALTGHMVLSTLHTNDVPSSFVRLVDMGVEPYLVNAAVEGVTAQRLLRKIDAKNGGYRGRVAVMEYSGMTTAIKKQLVEGADERGLRECMMEEGFVPMEVAARGLVERGVTDEAEVARVLGDARANEVEA